MGAGTSSGKSYQNGGGGGNGGVDTAKIPHYNEMSAREQTEARRNVVAVQMYKNGEIEQDTMGQIALGNFSDRALDHAVERKWITKAQADRIKKA